MRPARPNRRYQVALWIDRRIGPALCLALFALRSILRRSPPQVPDPIRKVLVLKMWGMGSIVLATPLLRALRQRHPEARIDLLTLGENRAIAGCVPEIDGVHVVDLSGGIPSFFAGTLGVLRKVRGERYDLLFDLEFLTRFSAIFSLLSGAQRSFGFSTKGDLRARLHDAVVPFNAYNHVALNFLALLGGRAVEPLPEFDAQGATSLPALAPGPAAERELQEILDGRPGYRPDRPLVVVNPNAGDMALERRWPEEHFVALLRSLCESRDVNVALIGSPGERDYVAGLARRTELGERLMDLTGTIDVPQLVALLGRADVAVTSDSGPLHVAAAAGTSTVALFGPETPTLYGPLRSRPEQRHLVHYRNLACSPCMFVHNNKVLSCWAAKALCMTGIEPSDVLASVDKLLAERAAH
jgi:lipopolysaccharide heptosyltransferase II